MVIRSGLGVSCILAIEEEVVRYIGLFYKVVYKDWMLVWPGSIILEGSPGDVAAIISRQVKSILVFVLKTTYHSSFNLLLIRSSYQSFSCK